MNTHLCASLRVQAPSVFRKHRPLLLELHADPALVRPLALQQLVVQPVPREVSLPQHRAAAQPPRHLCGAQRLALAHQQPSLVPAHHAPHGSSWAGGWLFLFCDFLGVCLFYDLLGVRSCVCDFLGVGTKGMLLGRFLFAFLGVGTTGKCFFEEESEFQRSVS